MKRLASLWAWLPPEAWALIGVFCAAAALIFVGAWLIYPPSAFLALGALMLVEIHGSPRRKD